MEDDSEVVRDTNDGIYRNVFEIISSSNNYKHNEILRNRLIDLSHNWDEEGMNFPNLCTIKKFLNSIRANRNDNFLKEPSLISFSSDQQIIFNLLDQQLFHMQSSNSINIPYKRRVIQGKAGNS